MSQPNHAPIAMDKITEFLKESLFYPCSGLDGAPIKFTGKHFQKFIYVDYTIERDPFLQQCAHPGFRGYRMTDAHDLSVESVFGASWEDVGHQLRATVSDRDFDWSPESAFILATHFERVDGFDDEHGPKQFDLWFIKCEAITTYRAIYTRRGIKPKCVAHIRSGIALGGNFSGYIRILQKALSENPDGVPDYILHDTIGGDPRWGDYMRLLRFYQARARWTYKTAHHGFSHLTLRSRDERELPDFFSFGCDRLLAL